MKITALTAEGYRNLNGTYGLPAPLAVIVGENNAGKSNVIDALRTIIEPDNPPRGRCWLGEQDFAHDGAGARLSDELTLEVRLEDLDGAEQSRMLTCLALEEGEGIAKLRLKGKLRADGRVRVDWFGGNSQNPDIDRHAREAIRFVYLHPLRDAAADLRPGRDNKLVALLAALTPENHQDREKVEELVEGSNEALGKVPSIANARSRVDQRLRGMTGAGRFAQKSTLAFGDPVFMRIVGALRAKIGELVALEMEQNGLGFNNLLYMAVLLAAIADAPDDEDPFLRVMLVEEPEAHLHPQLQDLLMKFIEGEASAGGATQVIVTSHSPTFASSAQVDRLAVMARPAASKAPVGRLPGAFGLKSEQLAYLRRFLDVTKASLFFARGVILVEGIAEQLLVPEFARRAGMDLAPSGVSVINIGGVAFAPFTDLFVDGGLPYRLAVISDADPKDDQDAEDDQDDQDAEDDQEGEATLNPDDALSARAKLLRDRVQGSQNAEAFFACQTLEWDLARIAANRPLMIGALRPIKPRVAAKLPDQLKGLEDDAAASKILKAIGREKGHFAQALAELLADDANIFEVPEYLERAIEWSRMDGIFTSPVELETEDADEAGQASDPVDGQ